MLMKFGIIGSGSWGTALAKIISDNGQKINWWIRSNDTIEQFIEKKHNPKYLPGATIKLENISFSSDLIQVINESDILIVAVPSAFVSDLFSSLPANILEGKKIVSAIKGILPNENLLFNDFLTQYFNLPLQNYFAILGPCHAEEVADERLSYLTISGSHENDCIEIAKCFSTNYLKTIVNKDIYGAQYAAILKNIYALGAGIAHGLNYGDNFLSVLIANSADEMAGFLRKAGIINAEVGYIEHDKKLFEQQTHHNYAASVYLGDLLVTCYSLHSRNRMFGTMIGKGYSIKNAQLEMNMVAEGYNASNCMFVINKKINAEMIIAETIYKILWERLPAKEGFKIIEQSLM